MTSVVSLCQCLIGSVPAGPAPSDLSQLWHIGGYAYEVGQMVVMMVECLAVGKVFAVRTCSEGSYAFGSSVAVGTEKVEVQTYYY